MIYYQGSFFLALYKQFLLVKTINFFDTLALCYSFYLTWTEYRIENSENNYEKRLIKSSALFSHLL